MATNKELTAKNRELKQQVKKLTMTVKERMQKAAVLDEDNDELIEKNRELNYEIAALKEELLKSMAIEEKLVTAISGFNSPAYETYLKLAERMGKKDTDTIDISIRVGTLRRVHELAMAIKQEEED